MHVNPVEVQLGDDGVVVACALSEHLSTPYRHAK